MNISETKSAYRQPDIDQERVTKVANGIQRGLIYQWLSLVA